MSNDVSVSQKDATDASPLTCVPEMSRVFSTVIPQKIDASSPESQRQRQRYWLKKTRAFAIALGVVPVVATGGLFYWLSTRALEEQWQVQRQIQRPLPNPSDVDASVPVLNEASDSLAASNPKSFWLTLMLILMGLGACLSGGLAWLWLKLLVNAVIRQSSRMVLQHQSSTQPEAVAEVLKGLGHAIERLQAAQSVEEIFALGVAKTQQSLLVDRAFLLWTSQSTRLAQSIAADLEVVAPGIARLLDPAGVPLESSSLEVELSQLFSVHPGYVQVCSEVRESDLPLPHQRTLAGLGVQAQLVTQVMMAGEPVGALVAQQVSQPRDWTDLEHQLFAALAQQMGLAAERCIYGMGAQVSSNAPVRSEQLCQLWQGYQSTCLELATAAHGQVASVRQAVSQVQALANTSQALNADVDLTHQTVQQTHQFLLDSQTAIQLSLNSVTEIQETMVQVTEGTQQLAELGLKATQISEHVKSMSDQIHYQVMNASITAGRRRDGGAEPIATFTHQMLEMTRQIKQSAIALETLADNVVGQSKTLAEQIDMGQEQILVGTEWFRETHQAFEHLAALNTQLESELVRLSDTANQQIGDFASASRQMLELSDLLNDTCDRSQAMADSIEQFLQQAPA